MFLEGVCSMMDLKVRLSKFKEFNDFKYLEKPQCFCSLFFGKDLPLVQLYDSTIVPAGSLEFPIGFAGSFKWEHNKTVPLDGDSYDERMLVYATREWENNGKKGIDILVEGDW